MLKIVSNNTQYFVGIKALFKNALLARLEAAVELDGRKTIDRRYETEIGHCCKSKHMVKVRSGHTFFQTKL